MFNLQSIITYVTANWNVFILMQKTLQVIYTEMLRNVTIFVEGCDPKS